MAEGPHEYRIDIVGDTMLVWQRGAPSSLEALHAFQQDLDRARTSVGIHRALFDNRQTTVTPDELRDDMLAWVCETGRFDAVAVVLQSDMLAVRLNMDAIAHRVRMRAFDSVSAAQRWLVDGRK